MQARSRPAACRSSPGPAARTATRRRRRCCSGRSCAAGAPSRWRRASRRRARRTRRRERRRSRAPPASRVASAIASACAPSATRARRHARDGEDAGDVHVVLHRQVDDVAVGVAGDDDADLGRERQSLLENARHAAERGEGSRQPGAIGDRLLSLAVVAESRRLEDAGQAATSATRSTSRAVAIDACGAQATSLRANAAFSAARSWHTETAAADGATGRRCASVASAAADTFSNSVVIAAQRSASRVERAADRGRRRGCARARPGRRG